MRKRRVGVEREKRSGIGIFTIFFVVRYEANNAMTETRRSENPYPFQSVRFEFSVKSSNERRYPSDQKKRVRWKNISQETENREQ